jgi:hypothetical protein
MTKPERSNLFQPPLPPSPPSHMRFRRCHLMQIKVGPAQVPLNESQVICAAFGPNTRASSLAPVTYRFLFSGLVRWSENSLRRLPQPGLRRFFFAR